MYDVGPGIARRNDDDGCVKPSLPKPPQHAQAIQPGKHDVEQNHVDVGRHAQLESPLSIVGKQDRMPFRLERTAQQIGGVRSVFGY